MPLHDRLLRRPSAPEIHLFVACLLMSEVFGVGDAAAQDLALVRANVVDVDRGEVRRDALVVVRDGRLERIEEGGVPPRGIRTLDVSGMYVSPGLVDAHVHIGDLAGAERALASGVTTARSMGTSHYADVGLRELAGRLQTPLPDLLAAGYHVRPGMAEAFFLDHPERADLRSAGVRGPAEVRRVARAVLERGVDFLKANATERAGLPETDPRKQLYGLDELRALVEEGEARGVPVAAHAHGDLGGRAAVAAGVRSIEHGTFLEEETLQLMAERGTYLVPTIAIVADLTVPGGDYDSPVLAIRGRYMLDRVRETAARALELGVPIAASTDTGYGPGSTVRLAHELEELVGIGMSPLQALRAGTAVAAELLGVDERTGRLAPGMEADLLVTERNPLEDVRALQDPLLVVSDGRIAASRGDWLAEDLRPRSQGGR